jgi:hypothetical protein
MYVETYIVGGSVIQATYTVVPVYVGVSVPVSLSLQRSTGLVTETDIGSEYQSQSLPATVTIKHITKHTILDVLGFLQELQ